MSYASSVHAKAIELIRRAVEMTAAAGAGHPTSAASLAHLTAILLYDHMRFVPARPDAPEADRLVLSEGHACPIVYAAAAELGIAIGADPAHRRPMTFADAMTLREFDSVIDGHPNPAEGFPFFPAATGSLGQGLSIAIGLALAARLDGIDRRVFCILGDAESREGQVWEAVDLLVDRALTNVCPIFNCNRYGQTGEVSRQQSADVLAEKLRAFGADVDRVDGHDPLQIRAALDRHALVAATPGRPFAIIADTVKGFGMPSLQGGGHHGKAPKAAQVQALLGELDETARSLGAHASTDDLRRRDPEPVPVLAVPVPRDQAPLPSFEEALRRHAGQPQLPAKMAPREAYGLALQVLGHARPDVVVLDADVGNSTYTERFAQDAELAQRFVQCGIAEQNMVSVAAGLAAGGKVPFAATFGRFLERASDQVEMALISRLPIKLCGSHVGLGAASDGPSQMALADVSFFRALSGAQDASGPIVHVLTPADARAAYALTLLAAEHRGTVYLRMARPALPLLPEPHDDFRIGGQRSIVEGRDLLIVAWGEMVHEAVAAARLLHDRGIDATVLDLYSIPIDRRVARDRLLTRIEDNARRVLVVEDNYPASLGTVVSKTVTAARIPVQFAVMAVRKIPKSARTPEDLRRHLGLDAESIARRGAALVGQESTQRAKR